MANTSSVITTDQLQKALEAINDYYTIDNLDTLSTSLADDDYFLVHNTSGDFKVAYSDLGTMSAFDNNSVGQIKSLGTVTASTIDEFLEDYGIVSGGTPKVYPGNYFTISYTREGASSATSINIDIAGINTQLYKGDTSFTTTPHIVCVPQVYFETAAMNSTNTTGTSANSANTSGLQAYAGSDMRNITIPLIDAKLENIFGDHLLTSRELLANTINTSATSAGYSGWTGASSSWTWYDAKCILLSEVEVYGSTVFSSSGYDTGIGNSQLPLFRLFPWKYNQQRSWYWLKNVASSASFCRCYGDGHSGCNTASDVDGVRPRFILG